jgi:hypothetical protein
MPDVQNLDPVRPRAVKDFLKIASDDLDANGEVRCLSRAKRIACDVIDGDVNGGKNVPCAGLATLTETGNDFVEINQRLLTISYSHLIP